MCCTFRLINVSLKINWVDSRIDLNITLVECELSDDREILRGWECGNDDGWSLANRSRMLLYTPVLWVGSGEDREPH